MYRYPISVVRMRPDKQFTWINKQNKVNYDLADYIRQFASRLAEAGTFGMMQRPFQVKHHPKRIPSATSSCWLIKNSFTRQIANWTCTKPYFGHGLISRVQTHFRNTTFLVSSGWRVRLNEQLILISSLIKCLRGHRSYGRPLLLSHCPSLSFYRDELFYSFESIDSWAFSTNDIKLNESKNANQR